LICFESIVTVFFVGDVTTRPPQLDVAYFNPTENISQTQHYRTLRLVNFLENSHLTSHFWRLWHGWKYLVLWHRQYHMLWHKWNSSWYDIVENIIYYDMDESISCSDIVEIIVESITCFLHCWKYINENLVGRFNYLKQSGSYFIHLVLVFALLLS
jgi:hypothetical protein